MIHIEPMLFHSADPATVGEYIRDREWMLQQKMDGMRCLVVIGYGNVQFLTRGGRPLKSSAAKQHFEKLTEDLLDLRFHSTDPIVFDAELLTDSGRLSIFDMPYCEELGITLEIPLINRWEALGKVFPENYPSDSIFLTPTAITQKQKRILANNVLTINAEGLIAKRLDSPYSSGERVRHSLKLKYSQTADVVIIDRNRGQSVNTIKGGTKINYIVAVQGEDGKLVEVGALSAIGREPMNVGDVIEVEYLYVGAAGRLVQPRMIKARTDKTVDDTSLEQLRYYSREIAPSQELQAL